MTRGGLRSVLGNEPRHQRDRDRGDRDVHEEDPPPADEVDDDAGDQDADRAAESGQAAPDPEGAGAFLRVSEQQHNEGERGGRGERFAGSLCESTRDQHGLVLCRAAGERCNPEHGCTDQEETPPSKEVAHPAAEEEEAARHQRVTIDDPGQTPAGEPQRLLDRGERHVHDGDVDDDHELDKRQYE